MYVTATTDRPVFGGGGAGDEHVCRTVLPPTARGVQGGRLGHSQKRAGTRTYSLLNITKILIQNHINSI